MLLSEMKPAKGADVTQEIAEVHTAARSPSPKGRTKPRSRSRSNPRKFSSGHTSETEAKDTPIDEDPPKDNPKTRDNWINSQQNESLDIELPIHDQIKQDILGFVEKELKDIDGTGKSPSFVFYSHDPNGIDEKYMKTLSRPSSGYKEKRSPSYRKKKRHSSKHRDRELQEFEIPGSSLSALERVDDYLKEYNNDEIVTLSGELEIEQNDGDNNNGSTKELRHKPRKTRRKTRDERQDSNANAHDGRDISPKVFKSALKNKNASKPARPTDLTAMLESLEANRQFTDQYIDNPFSSPSPLTSPNDERIFGRPERVYMQGGGTFQAVSRDRILSDSNANGDEDKYFRLGEHTPIDIAILVQKAWRGAALACHGVLGGLSLLHLLLLSCSDGLDAGHLSFHALVTMPYVAAYYFFCVLCLVSVLDRLDPESLDLSRGLHPHFQSIVLVILYAACLLVCTAARASDELMMYQYSGLVEHATANTTMPTIPEFYHTWAHLSIWRGVLAILGLVYCMASPPKDLMLKNLQAIRPVRSNN